MEPAVRELTSDDLLTVTVSNVKVNPASLNMRKLAAALHLVDRRFSQGDDQPQLLPADGAPERKGALRKLWQRLVGFRPWRWQGAAGIEGRRGQGFHDGLHEYLMHGGMVRFGTYRDNSLWHSAANDRAREAKHELTY